MVKRHVGIYLRMTKKQCIVISLNGLDNVG